MGIFDDSFSIELNHPLDAESWKVIKDVELDKTEHIYFTTPSSKRVDFIKADVLDKIRAEIGDLMPPLGNWMYDEGHIEEQTACEVIADVLQIINKYKAEREDNEC